MATLDRVKRCWRCQKTKPKSEFHRSARSKDGCQGHCKECGAAVQRDRRAANPEKHRKYMRGWYYAKHYGITVEQYNDLLDKQGGRCAICTGEPNGRGDYFHVDHDHATGVVRGLLCHDCNTGIGKLKDDPDLVRRALAYLGG